MGQIEKRKKKGRPSKADLAARQAAAASGGSVSPATEQSDIRRSLRRRSFRYSIIDYDEDYLDDDDNVQLFEEEDEDEDEEERKNGGEEEEDEEDEDGRRRREKKVKLVVKLSNSSNGSRIGDRPGSRRVDSASRRYRVRDDESEEEEEEEEESRVKKRRINGSEDCDDDEQEEDNVVNYCEDEGRNDDVETRRGHFIPGTPTTKNNHYGTSLPDKKHLELILDKLQKKDTYGVYAEPVDPDELPDYHDIIKHPMDFSTARKKLANGSYSTLEQFENDVFLISSNAMKYNAPETIYHKQARAIKELAERKFQRVRIQIERLEKESKSEINWEPKSEPKSEHRERSNSLVQKLSKKPLFRSAQEPVGSDFSCGATLATTDPHNTLTADLVGNFERHSNSDVPVDGLSFLVDNCMEKAEDLQSGKGILPKFGRRSFIVDENRRATYMSNQPLDQSDSLFFPFEDEKKQLIPVGLLVEYSYARSLARYAATLGPLAWRIAAKRIEQVLPGFKYGRGWVGEYEPLPTTVLVFKEQKEYPFVSKLHDTTESGKNDKILQCIAPAKEHLSNEPSSDGKVESIFGSGGAKTPSSSVSAGQQHNLVVNASEGSENLMLEGAVLNCLSPNNKPNGAFFQQRKQLPRDSVCTETMGAEIVKPNFQSVSDSKTNFSVPNRVLGSKDIDRRGMKPKSPPVSDQKIDHVSSKQPPGLMEVPTSRPVESMLEGRYFPQSFTFKRPDSNGGASEGLRNEKSINNCLDNNRVIVSSPSLIPTQLSVAAASLSQRQDYGLNDPVLVNKMRTEKAQRQMNGSIRSHSPSQVKPSSRGAGGSNAAAAAASAWMSVGAVGFRPAVQTPSENRSQIPTDTMYGGKQAFYPQSVQSHVEYPVSATMHFQPEKNGLPFQAFVQQQVKLSDEPQILNRPMVFPPFETNVKSRLQTQPSWRGLSPRTQQKQKQDTLPPDLNVAFQSVDSQQPDLALQL